MAVAAPLLLSRFLFCFPCFLTSTWTQSTCQHCTMMLLHKVSYITLMQLSGFCSSNSWSSVTVELSRSKSNLHTRRKSSHDMWLIWSRTWHLLHSRSYPTRCCSLSFGTRSHRTFVQPAVWAMEAFSCIGWPEQTKKKINRCMSCGIHTGMIGLQCHSAEYHLYYMYNGSNAYHPYPCRTVQGSYW